MPTNFEEKAATWDDDPAKVRRAEVVAEAIRAAVPLDRSTRLLEYGAGTALVSQALAGDVGPVTVAEPSAGMRSRIAEKVEEGALPPTSRVWALDLVTDDVPDERFDLVVIVMTLHHIEALSPVLRGLAALLEAGGHLCVVDLEQEDGSFHRSDPDFSGHNGFGRADLQERLESAGFTNVHFERCHEMEKDGDTYPLFLATCTADPG